jgi:hypothetical protein
MATDASDAASRNRTPKKGGGQRSTKRRPYRFDPNVARTIVRYLTSGAFIETAAAAAGISRSTLYEWLRRGREAGRGPFWEFSMDVEKALATSEINMCRRIQRAAQDGQWQAAAWPLERKFPERWRRRDSIEHTGPGGAPLQTKEITTAMEMTTGEKRARLAELLRRFASQEAAADPRESAAGAADREQDGKPGA